MFTLKLIAGGAESVEMVKNATILYPDSDGFKDALGLCNEETRGIGRVVNLLVMHESYEDEACTIPLGEAGNIFVHDGSGKQFSEPKCMVLAPHAGNVMDDSNYVFLYDDDKAYIMNNHGATISAVK